MLIEQQKEFDTDSQKSGIMETKKRLMDSIFDTKFKHISKEDRLKHVNEIKDSQSLQKFIKSIEY